MREGNKPFAGMYPTRDESLEALSLIGKADEAETIVSGEMGGHYVEGQLVDLLQRCRSDRLMEGWPHGLRIATAGLLAQRVGPGH